MEKTKICIIGCGTYGAYLLNRLTESFGEKVEIIVVEVGDKNVKNEEEIGITSRSIFSKASKDGRYFGLGGTSNRWGGQILFFDDRDNPNNNADWNKIIQINNTYREKVVEKLLGKNKFDHYLKEDTGDTKIGIWLKYGKRNLFKSIKKEKLKNVVFHLNCRVTDFNLKDGKISEITCKNLTKGEIKIKADHFFLTAGAIESCRLLMELNNKYKILNNSDLGKHFGDHLSVELFKIKNQKPSLNAIDLLPRVYKGNLITKRLVVSTKDGIIGYLHPIFNKEVKVFSSLKQLLFGKQKNSFKLSELFTGLVFLFRFLLNYLFLKKMYAHNNNWSLQLDIEQPFPNKNNLTLLNEKDRFGQKAISINWNVEKQDIKAISEIKRSIEKLLKQNGLSFTPVYNPDVPTSKVEDIYHPVGFIRMGEDSKSVLSMNCLVKGTSNLYHFSTAMFPSAKSINPTAAGFCFIESHLENDLEFVLTKKTELNRVSSLSEVNSDMPNI